MSVQENYDAVSLVAKMGLNGDFRVFCQRLTREYLVDGASRGRTRLILVGRDATSLVLVGQEVKNYLVQLDRRDILLDLMTCPLIQVDVGTDGYVMDLDYFIQPEHRELLAR